MEQKQIKLIVSTITLIALICAGCCMMKPVQRPEGCEDSIIYAKINNPAMVGGMLQIANLNAINEGVYKKDKAIIAITTIKNILDKEPVSFIEFIEIVEATGVDYFKKYNTELIMLDMALINLNVDLPIGECDKRLLRGLCDRLINQLKERK